MAVIIWNDGFYLLCTMALSEEFEFTNKKCNYDPKIRLLGSFILQEQSDFIIFDIWGGYGAGPSSDMVPI